MATKLIQQDREEIVALALLGNSVWELAQDYHVSPDRVQRILRSAGIKRVYRKESKGDSDGQCDSSDR